MLVLIAALEPDCPAATALAFEGVPTQVRIVQDDGEYGNFLAENWQGEVIVVEHDVVPWPGAISKLSGCTKDWCVHEYTFTRAGAEDAPRPRLGWALGCLRVNQRIVDRYPDLPRRWEGTPWQGMDSRLTAALQKATGQRVPHIHRPPFAHLKVRDDGGSC